MWQIVKEVYKAGVLKETSVVYERNSSMYCEGEFLDLKERALKKCIGSNGRFFMGYGDRDKFFIYPRPMVEGYYTKFYQKRV